MSEKRISGAIPESPESSASAFFTACSWAAFAPSAFATLFAERLALAEVEEELGDFEADTELEELEGLTSREWSSSVLLRERYPATQSAHRDGVIRAVIGCNSSKGGTAGTQRIVILAIKPVARCLAR